MRSCQSLPAVQLPVLDLVNRLIDSLVYAININFILLQCNTDWSVVAT